MMFVVYFKKEVNWRIYEVTFSGTLYSSAAALSLDGIEKVLKYLYGFSSIKIFNFSNATNFKFKFSDPADEAYFILIATSGIEIK